MSRGTTPSRRALGIAGAIALLIASTTGRAQRGTPSSDNPDRWLTGALDIHVHSSPDNVERSVDAVEAAMMARVHHMRGIVLNCTVASISTSRSAG